MRRLPAELVCDLVWLLRYRPRAFRFLVSQVRCLRVYYGRAPDYDGAAVEPGA